MAKEWSVKNLYLYLVCLVTLFLFVGGAISSINSAMSLALPDQPNVSLTYIYYPEYKEATRETVFDPPPLEELERRRAEQETNELYYQGYTKRSLLNAIALMVIAAPFYLYHWKRIKPSLRRGGAINES